MVFSAGWLFLLGLSVRALPLDAQESLVPLRALVEADWRHADGVVSVEQARNSVTRGRRLLGRLQAVAEPGALDELASRLNRVAAALEEHRTIDLPPEQTRDLWVRAHEVVREISFTNPLLRRVDKLLFITRHDPGGVFHMVDQFYGFNAKPGGRLLVLLGPFGDQPRVIDLLAGTSVTNGRLKGRKLERGSFLSPEVSFDGKTIVFAWTQAKGQDLEWWLEASYHLFRVNADGTGLVQLTDSRWNDFDPCFLPNGHIAFISERRGGFLRCGRYCPTYTLFGMAPDGTDITCLSYHETHEWQPSITEDGLIVYTRWDYVDRDTNMAHHPWTCLPDGSNPRALHGNYPLRRESRPWMEMDVRAIPGTKQYVATAAAHHGHAFGSLVIMDPEVPDDGAQSQLVRLTPEVPFPEAEKHLRPIEQCMVYGTAWPLGEDDFLCVYDPAVRNRGVYWIDRFGNRELLYRDPAISALSPMPLQARSTPPIVPEGTEPPMVARPGAANGPGTVALLNVYDSDFEWPAGTKVTALRVIQLLPKSTPAPNDPRIGVAEQSNARAVLGTVPVEADGSAYFEVPSGKAVYFQALNERGLAVQSMRSVTYLHAGERLVCQGCHEPRHRTPSLSQKLALALRRAPSTLRPDVDGSNPFSFVRLVQPALERNCVACHRAEQAIDLTDHVESDHCWTRSYVSLASKFGFYFHVFNGAISTGAHGGSRSIAGQFGAAASPLLSFLDKRHYNLSLSPEDWHRFTLWLDCNSEFFGAYEDTFAQSNGAIVVPALE